MAQKEKTPKMVQVAGKKNPDIRHLPRIDLVYIRHYYLCHFDIDSCERAKQIISIITRNESIEEAAVQKWIIYLN